MVGVQGPGRDVGRTPQKRFGRQGCVLGVAVAGHDTCPTPPHHRAAEVMLISYFTSKQGQGQLKSC